MITPDSSYPLNLADIAGRFQPIHYGHRQVHEYDVRRVTFEALNRLSTIFSCTSKTLEEPSLLHECMEKPQIQSVVIDEQ